VEFDSNANPRSKSLPPLIEGIEIISFWKVIFVITKIIAWAKGTTNAYRQQIV